jgi:hypothetical protein
MTFPIDQRDERSFSPGWRGEVFVCDVDRTYLATRFSSLSGMARIPLEFAVDKREIAGMPALLREVRRGPGPASRCTPLYFLSASPAQLRPVVERKMLLDGIEADGTTFKDWLGVLLHLRPRRLREQLGFKLTALLLGRRSRPPAALETLIGDDLESDPLAFCLYADLLAGRIPPERARPLLLGCGVEVDDAGDILRLSRQIGRPPAGAGVQRIFIRMERHAAGEGLLDFAPHAVGCRSALQMAFGLLAQGSIGAEGVLRVARELRARGQDPQVLVDQLQDAARRAILLSDEATQVREILAPEGLLGPARVALPDGPDPAWRAAAEVRSASPSSPWVPHRLLPR